MTVLGPLGGLACWAVCEIVGEALAEGVWWLVPKRITRFGPASWSVLTLAAVWGAMAWWLADPASDLRTGLACFSCVALPVVAVLVWVSATPAPERPPRARAGGGPLRNERLRAR